MSSEIRHFGHDFKRLVEEQPDQAALIANVSPTPKIITYSELDEMIARCLYMLSQHGLSQGDTVFCLMPNSVETVVLFLATIKGGYGFAPLPCRASNREVEYLLDLVMPKLCITPQSIDYEKLLVVAKNGLPIVQVGVDAKFEWLPKQYLRNVSGKMPRLYLATSGTTGEPKFMMLDTNRLWSSGLAFMEYHRLQDSSIRFWNYLPMSYLGGLFNLCLIPLCVGGSTVIDEQFSGTTFLQFWQTVQRFDINSIWLVPTMVRGLLRIAERFSPVELKHRGEMIKNAFLGTAPIDLTTKRRFEKLFGFPLLENFALSETTFFTTETRGNLADRLEGSVGEILPYVDLKFVPANDEKQLTEICVRSPFLFLGYLGKNRIVSKTFDQDGYLSTGDLGHLSPSNLLVIDGRKRDIIKKGGNYVGLREIEILAEQHESVQEAVAVKIAHDFYGESYVLYLQLKPEYNHTAIAAISQFIHQHVVQYKWPEEIVIKNEFPRTEGGKVKKHLLIVE